MVSIPLGDLRDSPPESNKTPFPISAICVFAFGLNSPIKNLGFLSEPCPTPITPPKLFFSSQSWSWTVSFISKLEINCSTFSIKNFGDFVIDG